MHPVEPVPRPVPGRRPGRGRPLTAPQLELAHDDRRLAVPSGRPLTIGRDEASGFQVAHPLVSRTHVGNVLSARTGPAHPVHPDPVPAPEPERGGPSGQGRVSAVHRLPPTPVVSSPSGLAMLQFVLSSALLQIGDSPVLAQLSWFVPARWGFALGASTIGVRSGPGAPPPDTEAEPLWDHTAGTWLVDLAAPAGRTARLLRRLDPRAGRTR